MGELTQRDNKLSYSRTISKTTPEYYCNARHFLPLVFSYTKYNNLLFTNAVTDKATVKTHHVSLGNSSQATKVKCLALVLNNAKYAENCGL